MNSNGNLTLIGPFTQLISLSKLPLKGALRDEELEIIENAGIILFIYPTSSSAIVNGTSSYPLKIEIFVLSSVLLN